MISAPQFGIHRADPADVSVVLLTFNHQEFVEKALRSIMDQDFPGRMEVVVTDDCSTDDTLERVRRCAGGDPRVRVLTSDRNRGMHANLRRGLEASHGRYVALLEGDDFWTDPAKLRIQAEHLDRHPGDAAVTHLTIVSSHDKSNGSIHYPELVDRARLTERDVIEWILPHTSSLVYRRDLLPTTPPWFDQLAMGDWPMVALLAQQGRVAVLQRPMSTYRRHGESSWNPMARVVQKAHHLNGLRVFRDEAGSELPGLAEHTRSTFDTVFDQIWRTRHPVRAYHALAVVFSYRPVEAASRATGSLRHRGGAWIDRRLVCRRRRRLTSTPPWSLCVAADERFALPLLLTLRSVARSCPDPIDLVLVADGLTERTLDAVRSIGDERSWTIRVVDVAGSTQRLIDAGTPLPAGLSRSSLARLFLAEVMPSDRRRAVYIDTDVMVHSDLADLASVELHDNIIGAVHEAADMGEHLGTFARHGYDVHGRYFNSGVLVIDLEAWRARGESAALANTIDDVTEWITYADQDYLNAHFAGRWQELESEWNLQSRLFYPRRSRIALRRGPVDLSQAWRRRAVIHFNAPRRPWTPGSHHPGRPSYLLSWARSPFRSWPAPDGSTVWRLLVDRATFRSAADALIARFSGAMVRRGNRRRSQRP